MKYIANKRLKVGNKIINRGEEIKNFRFFKRQNKSALLNMGWVMQMEDYRYEEYLKEIEEIKNVKDNGNKSKKKTKNKSKKNEDKKDNKEKKDNEENGKD